VSRSKGVTFGLSGSSDSSELVPGGFTELFGRVDGRTFSVWMDVFRWEYVYRRTDLGSIIFFIISDDNVGKNGRGRLLRWLVIFNKAREDLVARSTANNPGIAGRTEWNGDLELLLVKDKDNLIAKVGRVSTPVVMHLLAVVLG
jgi:hypothetical protein